MRTKNVFAPFVLVLVLGLVLAGCDDLLGSDDDESSTTQEETGNGDDTDNGDDIPDVRVYSVATYDELAAAFTSPDGPVRERLEITITADIDFSGTDGAIEYYGDLDIHLIGTENPILDGGDETRFFVIYSEESAVRIEGLTFTNGNSASEDHMHGGAIRVRNELVVRSIKLFT